jgi:hypothetical protein
MKKLLFLILFYAGLVCADGLVTLTDPLTGEMSKAIISGVPTMAQFLYRLDTTGVVSQVISESQTEVPSCYAVSVALSANTNTQYTINTNLQAQIEAETNRAIQAESAFVSTNTPAYTNAVELAGSALQSETLWIAASNSVIYTNSAEYTDTVSKAASALQELTGAVTGIELDGVTNAPDASGVLHIVLQKDITGFVTNIIFQ